MQSIDSGTSGAVKRRRGTVGRRLGPIGIYKRARYYRRLLGTSQTVKLYGASALRRSTITLRVPGVGHPLLCRLEEPDRFTLCHIFAARWCEVPIPLNPRLIVDAGANVGYASVFYANAYPGASIIALEPDANNLETARLNVAPYPQVELLRAGLWSQDGALEISNPAESSWAFALREATSGSVPGISVPTLLGRSGHDRIDILKLNIEGGEQELFTNGWEEWLPRVNVVLVQTHGEQCEKTVATAMSEAGFRLVRERPARLYVHPASEIR